MVAPPTHQPSRHAVTDTVLAVRWSIGGDGERWRAHPEHEAVFLGWIFLPRLADKGGSGNWYHLTWLICSVAVCWVGMLVGNKITILAIVYSDNKILRILKWLAVMTNTWLHSLLVLVYMRWRLRVLPWQNNAKPPTNTFCINWLGIILVYCCYAVLRFDEL